MKSVIDALQQSKSRFLAIWSPSQDSHSQAVRGPSVSSLMSQTLMLEQRWLQTTVSLLINSILEVSQTRLLPPNLSLRQTYCKLTNCVPLPVFRNQSVCSHNNKLLG